MQLDNQAYVCALIVTYANRYEFLVKVINSALANGVNFLVIVDNNSHPKSRKQLINLENKMARQLKVIYNDTNLGSAGGYKIGLDYIASCSQIDFIWLLDDYNLPKSEALASLLHHYDQIKIKYSDNPIALLSLRIVGRPHFQRLAAGYPPSHVFPLRSSFRGLHLFNKPLSLYRYVRREWVRMFHLPHPDKVDFIKIPYAPYGGLLFHRTFLSKVGIPDETFFLYADDREFTYRFTRQGGGIFLIPDSLIEDLDLSDHNTSTQHNQFLNLLMDDPTFFKTFYLIRNNAFFSYHFWMDSKFLYTINKWIFWLVLFFYALKTKRIKRFFEIHNAIHLGELGILGKVK